MTREESNFLSMRWFLFLFIGTLTLFIVSSLAQAEPAKLAYKLPESMKGAEYIGTETCSSCHDKAYKDFQLSTHSRIKSSDEGVAQGCEMCHGPGSIHADNGGGKDNILSPGKNPEICFTCHLDKKAEFHLPFRHPVLEGKMTCADCHSPHGTDVKPWTATSMDDVNEACFKCHNDKRGPFVYEHAAIREGCTTCHKVHGSVNDKMLVARDLNLCLRCHVQVDFPAIGEDLTGHSSRLPGGSCFSAGCHTAVHGSNFEPLLRY